MLGLKYSGWLENNNGLGTMFDTNNNSDKIYKMNVGSGKTIKGWDQGVIGIR